MRRAFSVLATTSVLISCGVFSSASDTPSNSPPPGGTPDQHAMPPVEGAPLTGIFASSSKGVPDADGSMEKPYKTLREAIAVAFSTHQRVIACNETYEEAIEVPDGVSVYGYYNCVEPKWKRVNE